VDSDYTVFIHALDADGQLIAQFDGPPMNGLYPTDAWLPGQIVADTHAVRLPRSVHSLAVGLYDAQSLTRLPVTDADGQALPNDAIILQIAGGK
jgi:hypothetical protein